MTKHDARLTLLRMHSCPVAVQVYKGGLAFIYDCSSEDNWEPLMQLEWFWNPGAQMEVREDTVRGIEFGTLAIIEGVHETSIFSFRKRQIHILTFQNPQERKLVAHAVQRRSQNPPARTDHRLGEICPSGWTCLPGAIRRRS